MNDTLTYYRHNAREFVAGTVDVDMSAHHRRFLELLPQQASILDLGCGSGRDSRFFAELGHRVTAVDGAPELCRMAQKLTGFPVRCLLFEDLDYTDAFDGVWACASLLHVEKGKMQDVLGMVARSMKSGGILYVSYKYGPGHHTENGRYYSDNTVADIPVLFPESGDLQCINWWITQDERPERSSEKWINILCRKR